MQQFTQQISVKAQGRRIYDITPQVLNWANSLGLQTGLLTLYIPVSYTHLDVYKRQALDHSHFY